jgi:16S rRNA (cytosine967-C5)-methyltransferase
MNAVNPANSSMQGSARQCAVGLLADVLERKRSFDEAVAHSNTLGKLSERDRNFTRLLVLTCLRRLGQIDAMLAGMLAQPLRGRTQDVQHCLRIGVAQLVWLKTPVHAAVNETVETVEALGHVSMKGVVNAVLKRVAKEGEGIIAAQDEAMLNVPAWFYTAWSESFGVDAARAIALARLNEAPLDITVKSDAEGWANRLGATLLPTESLRLTRAGRVEELMGFAEGEWWVQDAAAALPVYMLGDVKGKTVLDLCAAPGGKTAQLASAGAKVVAVDQSKRRLDVLASNMQRLHLSVEMVEADILKWKCDVQADAILLDAPCSATGTLRRHPELVWHRTPEDLTRLVEIQKRLLRRAAKWLKPVGKLVYCVCSLQKEEGADQVKAFLASHPDFTLVKPEGLPKEFVKEGVYTTHPGMWPERGGVDGFYAALLVKS